LTSLDATTSVDFEQKTSNEEPSVTENRLSYMVSEARRHSSAPFHWRLEEAFNVQAPSRRERFSESSRDRST
jgi:hypothetical protein